MKDEIEIEPRYSDTDQMGIIYHANYLSYFEVARTNFFKNLGYSYRKLEDEGILLPVISASCNYKHAIKFGDKIIIKVSIEYIKRIKLAFNYKIYRKRDEKLMATGQTEHGFVTKDLKPIRLKKLDKDFQKILNRLKK